MNYPQSRGRRNSREMLTPLNILNRNGRRTPSPLAQPRKNLTEDPSKPLLETDTSVPPLARPETDTESDERDTVNRPYPGVDDGFFSNPREENNPDVENVPTNMPEAPPLSPKPSDQPDIGRFPANHPKSHPGNGRPDANFPYAPGFGPEIYNIPDFGTTDFGPGESIPDVNVYQHKKTLAQGMMDLALFSANANQLRYVLESYDRHPYYYPSLSLISISLIIQVSSILVNNLFFMLYGSRQRLL